MNLSQENNNIHSTLQHMLIDLKLHRRDKANLFITYVNKRLEKSLKNYYSELVRTEKFLLRRDAFNVMKKSLKIKE